jgi:putative tryptophan/tyrosine transport system substrate-binding protein
MNPRRRWLAAGAAWPALAWTGALRAQAEPPVVIGFLIATSRGGGQGGLAFHEGMAARGWKEGTQYVVEGRYADGRVERLPELARELAAFNPAVILASPSTAARAAAAAAPTTPIVLIGGDPLSTGLVKSLARPEGLITGLSNVSSDLNLKVLQLLVESLPKLRRVGFLADSTGSTYSSRVADVRRAAEQLRVEAVIVEMAKPEDIEPAMARLAKEKVQALVLLASAWFAAYQVKIVQLAQVQRWPVVSSLSALAGHGGLFSYSPDGLALVRRSAYYVDRILKGAKPGDLPIEQPTTFVLVLNLKTAKQLGITIPPSLRVQATEVIE